MGRGDLEAAGAEIHVYVFILDHRYLAAHQRHYNALPFQVGVFRVVGVDAHRRVAHDRLGARRGHYGVAVLACYVVAQIVELAVLLFVDHFDVAQSGLGLRIPVDHPLAAVDQSAAVKVDKHLGDALRAQFIHGEGCPAPVARGAELAQLLQDDAAVLVSPVPCVLQELLAGKIALLDPFLGKLGYHLGLGGYRGMVGAGHPEGVLARHAGAAHQYVLYGVVEHVAHVEHTGDVGRRDYYRVRFARVGSALEEVMTHPVVIPFVLNLRRVVLGGKLVHLVHMVRFVCSVS